MSKKKVTSIYLISGGFIIGIGITSIAYGPLFIIVGVFTSLYGLFK